MRRHTLHTHTAAMTDSGPLRDDRNWIHVQLPALYSRKSCWVAVRVVDNFFGSAKYRDSSRGVLWSIDLVSYVQLMLYFTYTLHGDRW